MKLPSFILIGFFLLAWSPRTSVTKKISVKGFIAGMFGVGGGQPSNALGLYDYFGTNSNTELMEGLMEIQWQLEGIKRQIDQLFFEVKDLTLTTQYIGAQRVIEESIRCFNAYANMTEQADSAYWLREFNKYGSLVRESTNFLMGGMLGTGFIASDILKTICQMSKGNSKLFTELTDNYWGLINSGLCIHSTFIQYINTTSERANGPVRDLFASFHNDINLRIIEFNTSILNGKGCPVVPSSPPDRCPEFPWIGWGPICPSWPLVVPANHRYQKAVEITNKKTAMNIKRPEGKWVAAALKVSGYVADMFSTFVANGIGLYSRLNNPNTIELYDEIMAIHDELIAIKGNLDEVISAVKEASIRAQYASCERIIYESYRIVGYYLNMTESTELNTTQEDIDYWQGEFAKWGGLVRESVSFLMEGLLGGSYVSGDILETITELVPNHDPVKVEVLINNTLGIVNVGLYVHSLYARFSNISEKANAPVVNQFESNYTAIGIRIKQTVRMQEYGPEVVTIIINAMSKGGNTMTNKENVYAALKERYSYRDWFVVVYTYNKDYKLLANGDVRTPIDEHYFGELFYQVTYNTQHVAAISFPTNNNTEKASLNSATITAVNNKAVCGKNNQNQQSAKRLADAMRDQIKSSCPNCNIGVIPKEYCSPCVGGWPIEQWHACSWQAYKFGNYIDGELYSCNSKDGNGLINGYNGYQPFAIFTLPPTRKFTIAEKEQAIVY